MRILACNAHAPDSRHKVGNNGDAALLEVLGRYLERNNLNEVCAVPDLDVLQGGATDRSGRWRELFRRSNGVDAIIVAGGTVLADDQPGSPFRGHPRSIAGLSAIARVRGVPLAFLGVGVEEVRSRRKRAALGHSVKSATYLSVRDSRSYDTFIQEFPSVPVSRGADLFWLLHESEIPKVDPSSRAIFALASQDLAGVERFLTGPMPSAFLCMDERDGRALALSDAPDPGCSRLITPSNWRLALKEIARSRVVIASRMHALYFAASVGVPMVAVATSGKVRSFADEFQVPFVSGLDALPEDVMSIVGGVASPTAIESARARAHGSVVEALGALLP